MRVAWSQGANFGSKSKQERQKRLSGQCEEQGAGAKTFLGIACGLPTSNSHSDAHPHYPEKPFEFYHLDCRKKLTPQELTP